MEGRFGGISHEVLLELLRAYPNTYVVTPNQDQLFEDALSRSHMLGNSDIRVCVTADEWASRRDADLLKIHGELQRPSTLVMSRDETERLPAWKRDVLASILADTTLVFIGYSFRDNDVIEVLRSVSPKRCYCVEPFVSHDFIVQRWALQEGIHLEQIALSAEAACSLLSRELELEYQTVLWCPSDAEFEGALRGIGNEWNHNPVREIWTSSRVLGAGPGQDAMHQWGGGKATFRCQLNESWQRRIQKGSVAIHVPPGIGKGIHGGKGSNVHVAIRVDDWRRATVRYACRRRRHFQTYYAHDDRDKMPRRALPSVVVRALRKGQSVELVLDVPRRCCVDISGMSLQLRLETDRPD
jgi:hypothetical protein